MDNPPLLLIDGSSFIHRAYHGYPEQFNSKGHAIHALYGIGKMLVKLLRMAGTRDVVFVLDHDGKTFRHELYPEYKANRPPKSPHLERQIQLTRELVHLMGLPYLSLPGVEADDVIGTLARSESAYRDVIIGTCDKDMCQLVTQQVTLLNTMTDNWTGVGSVVEKYGVSPDVFCDFLALIGDKTDNIPGVDSVGEKTAAKLLSQFNDLAGVIANANGVKGKLGDRLREAVSFLPLYRQLTKIKCDLDAQGPLLSDFSRKEIDYSGVKRFSNEHEVVVSLV